MFAWLYGSLVSAVSNCDVCCLQGPVWIFYSRKHPCSGNLQWAKLPPSTGSFREQPGQTEPWHFQGPFGACWAVSTEAFSLPLNQPIFAYQIHVHRALYSYIFASDKELVACSQGRIAVFCDQHSGWHIPRAWVSSISVRGPLTFAELFIPLQYAHKGSSIHVFQVNTCMLCTYLVSKKSWFAQAHVIKSHRATGSGYFQSGPSCAEIPVSYNCTANTVRWLHM